MNDIEILEEYIKELNKNKKKHELAYSTSFGKYWSDFGKAIENLIQRLKDLEQILELTSKSLDNISYDQIPIAIEELKFKLQDLEKIEKEHKEENGRLREEVKKYETMIINHKKQLSKSGIYGYDYDLKILEESD